MHTKKRHQNMFQDLNRKLHHAEKDRESPASDTKVKHQGRTTQPPSRLEEKEQKKGKKNKFEHPLQRQKNKSKTAVICADTFGCPCNKDAFSSFLVTVCEMECFFWGK